jgi:uncharacterized membrane protein
MDKQTFLRRLEEGLRQLPPEEREDILAYHREYFQDAGPEQEAKVIQELGDPDLLARRLLSEYGEQPPASPPPPPPSQPQPEAPKKKRPSGVLVAILAVLAAPIALPLAAALGAVAIALAVAALSVALALMAVIVGVLVTGFALVALGFSALLLYPPAALVVLGAGLVCCGLGLFGVMPVVRLIQAMFRGLANLFRKAFFRRKTA